MQFTKCYVSASDLEARAKCLAKLFDDENDFKKGYKTEWIGAFGQQVPLNQVITKLTTFEKQIKLL